MSLTEEEKEIKRRLPILKDFHCRMKKLIKEFDEKLNIKPLVKTKVKNGKQ
ncbi:MAG: hypothetical protein KKE05_04270 [Nanoarchaeota archaeon]|nr:hypothetical protein [Nanoarchaeota archaeon]